ncbi:hypothetical protein ACIOD2_32515 [Amycolatopsis sp. NPDC088138]|uniref:hypothetical protein n=1 Tax=Amycolatopsis sp. NPDC088138 TaxID=3363938 RepID=UPI0037F2FAFD
MSDPTQQQAPTTQGRESIAAEYVIDGEWLSERVERCTCGLECDPDVHEDRCGWEPRVKVADVAQALRIAGWLDPGKGAEGDRLYVQACAANTVLTDQLEKIRAIASEWRNAGLTDKGAMRRACAILDGASPSPGPGCYPPVDGWDGVSIVDDKEVSRG